jgi:hypothetical protein
MLTLMFDDFMRSSKREPKGMPAKGLADDVAPAELVPGAIG